MLKDSYTGEKLGARKRNLTYSLTFRDAEKTLTDDAVNAITEKLKQQLRDELKLQTM